MLNIVKDKSKKVATTDYSQRISDRQPFYDRIQNLFQSALDEE